MKDPAATTQREQTRRQGLLASIAALPLRMLGVLVGSLLLSILIECIGMHLFWPDQGMLDYELNHLSNHFTRSAWYRSQAAQHTSLSRPLTNGSS